jgi:hypothetical protein
MKTKRTPSFLVIWTIAPLMLLFSGCATYYQRTMAFQEQVVSGNIPEAGKILDKKKKDREGKNQMLYLLNRGWVDFMLQQHELSNLNFERADLLMEDYRKKLGFQALSLLSNPSIQPYMAEDFEMVMVNYFKSVNFLQLGNLESAGVEAQKINNKLNALNDKYKDHKNRYQRDAFSHLMMGLVFDASRDYNNAFIAYRNALEVYETDYSANFGVGVPEQLKKDLLRTAYLTGFKQELRQYEEKFGMTYRHQVQDGGELVFFWHNGFGPVKSEWSLNFSKIDGQGGWVTLVNEEMGLNFPFYIGDRPSNEKNAFGDLKFVRMAFPRYLERKPVFQSAEIAAAGKTYPLELTQNINEIAFKTLNDRMLREVGNSLLRLATKQALEMAVRHENKDMGALVSIANALTEKADTRNWQTLPNTISYCRISLPTGPQTIQFRAKSQGSSTSKDLTFSISKGKTQFFVFQNVETFPPSER